MGVKGQKAQNTENVPNVLHNSLGMYVSENPQDILSSDVDTLTVDKQVSLLESLYTTSSLLTVDEVIENLTDDVSHLDEDLMTLSDMLEVLEGHNSILQEDTLISVTTEFQDELLELDELLYGSISGVIDNTSTMIPVLNGTTAKSIFASASSKSRQAFG